MDTLDRCIENIVAVNNVRTHPALVPYEAGDAAWNQFLCA